MTWSILCGLGMGVVALAGLQSSDANGTFKAGRVAASPAGVPHPGALVPLTGALSHGAPNALGVGARPGTRTTAAIDGGAINRIRRGARQP